jgi:F0F1-type ATP synthase assembly protein I
VHDPIAAGRSAAARAVAIEVAAVGLVAAGFLLGGTRAALGVLAGGLAMAAGHAVAARLAFAGGIQPARLAFARLLLGVMGKWLVALVVVAMALAVWRLPPLPVVAGVAVAMLAYLVGLNLRYRPRRQD